MEVSAVEVNFFLDVILVTFHCTPSLFCPPIHWPDPSTPTLTSLLVPTHPSYFTASKHTTSNNVSILFIITRFDQYRYSLPSVISHWTCPSCSLGHVHNFFRVSSRGFFSTTLGSWLQHAHHLGLHHPCQLYDDDKEEEAPMY